MELKNKLIAYMKEKKISVKQVAEDTGIKMEKLQIDTSADLNATELCVLCTYLDVRPENYYEKKYKE